MNVSARLFSGDPAAGDVWYSLLALNDEPSDRELVTRCLMRQESAWEQVVHRYRRKVFGMAYKFTGRFQEAEDLTQDIFLKVYRSLGTYDQSQEFIGWLLGITRNACIDHYRRAKREKVVSCGDMSDLKHFKSTALSPHGDAEAAERSRLLREGLNELPEDLRAVLVLRDLRGLSYREIVDRLNINEGTVKSRIFRGRAALAEKIRHVLLQNVTPRSLEHGPSQH